MEGELLVVNDVPGEFTDRVVEAWHSRPGDAFKMALTGGPTARTCYERLAADADTQIDWWRVDLFWTDETCTPPDHPDSNHRLAREALLERVGAANATYPMRCEDGTDFYQLRLGELGLMDVVHLGLGEDGRVASLFPGSPALDADPGRLVTMNHDPSGQFPHERITLTFAGLARTRLALVTVMGESKAEALAAVVRGDDVPGSRLTAPKLLWLADPAAASLVP